jgi:selenocysteine lyase/cysteine desulfurase
VAARLSAEHAIGVRHGCFCAHPYLIRLLGLSSEAVQRYRKDVLAGDRRSIPEPFG